MAVDMIGEVLAATRPADIFGSADADAARPVYRRLARSVHPDRHPDDADRAGDAFANLDRLWQQLLHGEASAKRSTIQTKKHVYELGDLLARGDVANVYRATYDDGRENVAVKIARRPSDADLMSAEARALKKLREVPEEFRAFHPDLLDSFRYRDAASGKERSALVTPHMDGFYTLTEVRAAYPLGLDPRDMAWMFRRVLVAIGTAHDLGFVHGAVTPDNVMIHPEHHGLVLIGWTCSVEDGSPLSAISPAYRDWYPADALAKKPVSSSLDIAMAAASMRYMLPLPPGYPRQFAGFFRGCQISSPPPAGELLGEFDELLERLYGRRTYRPFSMPRRKDS